MPSLCAALLVALANGALAAGGGALAAERLAAAAGADGGKALVAAWVGALALAATLVPGCLAALAARWRRLPRAVPPLLLVVVNAAVLLALVLDLRAYVLLGVHLHSPVSLDALSNPGATRELALGAATVGAIAAIGVGLAAAQGALLWLARRVAARAPRPSAAVAAAGALASVAVLAVVGARGVEASPVHDALPAWELLAGGEPWRARAVVRWPQAPLVAAPGPRPDVVFVVVESLRHDAPAEAPMERLRALAAERRCLTPERHHSGGHTTEYGVFTLLYGLESHRYGPFGRDGLRSLPLSLLRDRGYRLVGASASGLRDWNDAAFVVEQLDAYEETVTDGAWDGDEAVVRAAERWAREDGPVFAFLFLNATHHNYIYPPAFEAHRPVVDPGYDHFLGDDALAERRDEIRNRYLNAALYVDDLVARIAAAFSRRPAILVVTGDHGEELWEHGLLGHGAPRFVEERIRVPLLLCLPGVDGAAHPVARSSHVDVWPTVLDALGVENAPAAWSDGRSLLRPAPGDDVHVIGGTTFPWGNPTGCVVDGDRKVWLRVGAAPGPVLRPTRVTDLDDRPLPGADPRPSVARALERLERFVELRWEGPDGARAPQSEAPYRQME